MSRDTSLLAARAAKRLLATSLFAVGLMAASTGGSQASITPNDVDHWQHIVDCAAALFNNPAEHAKYCGPGHAEVLTFKTSFYGSPPPVTVPTPPPPLVEMCDGVPCEINLQPIGQ